MSSTFNCLRCNRLTTVANINKSDGICDACDSFDPSCGAASAPPPNLYGMTPCPFCGSGRISLAEGTRYGAAPVYRVKCECGAKGPSEMNAVVAIAKWNQRSKR